MSDAERLAAERAAIENCETTPIHDVGIIQPFGALIATDAAVERITRVSANVGDHLGVSAESVLGALVGDLLPHGVVHQIRNSASHRTIADQREFVGCIDAASGNLDVSVYATADEVVIELEPRVSGSADPLAATSAAQRALTRLCVLSDIDQLLQAATDELRGLTGFDRVKAYRFLPDHAGEVVAESRGVGIDSFLGLRFPAYDIPRSARRTFALTPRRNIASVAADPVPIIDADDGVAPLDLTLALLRGVVPAHTLYLGNMGVAATMSIPIIIAGELWGLFAHHHYSDFVPTAPAGAATEIVSRTLSLHLQSLIERQRAGREIACSDMAARLFAADDSPLGLSSSFSIHGPAVAELWDCDGVALIGQGRVDSVGDTPGDDVVDALVRQVVKADDADDADEHGGDPPTRAADASPERRPFATNSLAALLPGAEFGPSAGALVLPEPVPFFDALVVFRNRTDRQVTWAGKPAKDIERVDDGFRLNPRASFSAYIDSVAGNSDDWTTDDLALAGSLQAALDRTHSVAAVHGQNRERLGLLVRELNHRVRNILALVQSLIRQSGDQADSLAEFVESLGGRIRSLADAHSLVTDADWREVDLGELLTTVLTSDGTDDGRLRIRGPAVEITADLASMLALVLYEMAANASKYGAWAQAGGRVVIEWSVGSAGLELIWKESGGPLVKPPTREGFGTAMIRGALPFEFDADVTLDYEPDGLRATISVPTGPFAIDDRSERGGPATALVVEDDFLISREVVEVMRNHGATEVLTAATVRDALAVVSECDLDFVVLDANLRGEFSGPVAEQLRSAGVPFVFVSGYGSQDEQLRGHGELAVFTKPLDEARLASVLSQITWRSQ